MTWNTNLLSCMVSFLYFVNKNAPNKIDPSIWIFRFVDFISNKFNDIVYDYRPWYTCRHSENTSHINTLKCISSYRLIRCIKNIPYYKIHNTPDVDLHHMNYIHVYILVVELHAVHLIWRCMGLRYKRWLSHIEQRPYANSLNHRFK